MPIVNYNLPESGGLDYSMVVNSVCRDIARRMELSDETIFYVQHDGEEVEKQPNASLRTDNLDVYRKARLAVPTKMTVTYDRYVESDHRLTNRMVRPGTPALFIDKSLNFFIKPVYRYTTTTINISMRFKTRAEARQWLRTAEQRLNARITDEYHEVEYSYPLPQNAFRIICEVFDRKYHWMDVKPETLPEYIRRCMSPRVTTVVNQSGKNRIPMVKEIMGRIVGSPTFIDSDINDPDAEKNGTYAATISYQFTHDMIDGITVGFPQYLHNAVMPMDLIEPFFKRRDGPYRRHEIKSASRYYIDTAGEIETNLNMPNRSLMRAMQPEWDEWQPDFIDPNMTIALASLVILNPAAQPHNRRNIIGLEQLGNWQFKPHAMDYIRENYQYLDKYGSDVFHITVYDGRNPCWDNPCWVDSDLIVRFKHDPDYDRSYHVAVMIYFDIGVLPAECHNRLIKHYDLSFELITMLYRGQDSLTLRQMPDGSMHRGDFMAAMRILRDQRYITPKPTGGIFPLVSLSSISAERKQE